MDLVLGSLFGKQWVQVGLLVSLEGRRYCLFFHLGCYVCSWNVHLVYKLLGISLYSLSLMASTVTNVHPEQKLITSATHFLNVISGSPTRPFPYLDAAIAQVLDPPLAS